jgi:major vault protein
MSIENRQKIPVPRRSFLWSLNETSGEILTHVGPTEFTPSANDRIVRANDRAGYESAPMEARPFVVARDGEYVVLSNPIRGEMADDAPNGTYVPGGNKEKDLALGTKRIVPGPCAFPLWPGQSAEVRPAHKLGANHYLLVEVVGPLDEKARYYRLAIESAGLSSAVIDSGEGESAATPAAAPALEHIAAPTQLRHGQRIVIQGRHTQLFIPPSGIEIVPPSDEVDPTQFASRDNDEDGRRALPPNVATELATLIVQVREGMSAKQFSVLKNELRHRNDLTAGHKAVVLTGLDSAFEDRQQTHSARHAQAAESGERRSRALADPYARRAVVLGPKEFCILFDADGIARIVRGPARVFPGPYDTFMQRGSRRRVYDAYELAEHQALWLRIITPISREKLAAHLPPGFALDREQYDAGHEFVVRGLPSVFFPFIEAEVIHPVTREPHNGNDHGTVVINAIGIDQKSGIYVRDLRTGMVKMARGQTSYLVDPRFEEHVHRRVPREQWNLWIGHAEAHKVTTTQDVVTPWAISVSVPNNEACLITSRHGRRVEVGPKVVLLEYEEQLTPMRLSKGPSKDGHNTTTTCFLRVQGGRVADTFEVESADFVRFKLRLGFAGHFEGDAERWFQVDDPVKLLADTVRARLREAVRLEPAVRILREVAPIVRGVLFPAGEPFRFAENGMVVDHVDVLAVAIVDNSLSEMFTSVQREAVKLQLQDAQATRRIESARHQDTIDAEEHALLRAGAARKVETSLVETETSHKLEARNLELKSDRRDASLARDHAHEQRALEHWIRVEQQKLAVETDKRTREAEAEARADEARYKVDEAHMATVSTIQRDKIRAVAEAEAIRLAAVQRELVGALHAAADSEVMKAAANNMNLVALLGGKSPAELLGQIVRGTALERTSREMMLRSGSGNGAAGAATDGDPKAGDDGGE